MLAKFAKEMFRSKGGYFTEPVFDELYPPLIAIDIALPTKAMLWNRTIAKRCGTNNVPAQLE
jgi:hypothetical protein